jgi:hypothetical protein
MRIVAFIFALVALLTVAPARGDALGNPFPDLDIGSLISKGKEFAKQEADAKQVMAGLEALKESKERSDKIMADWKPKVDAYLQDCDKTHVWNKDVPAQAAAAQDCQRRLGAMNPPYTKDKTEMQRVNADLAAVGISQDRLSDWQALLAKKHAEALQSYKIAVSMIAQWRTTIKVTQLMAPMQDCLRHVSVGSMTDEVLVQTFSQCWDGARAAPPLASTARGTNAFSATPVSDADRQQAAIDQFKQSGSPDPGANVKRRLDIDHIDVPSPSRTKPVECSLMEWFTEPSGNCERRRRQNLNSVVNAVRG